MSVIPIPFTNRPSVTVTGDRLTVHDLVVVHGEAAAITRRQEDDEARLDLLRKAIPVGLIALAMGSVDVGSRAIIATLDDWGTQVDLKSRATLSTLDTTLRELRLGEQAVLDTANHVLAGLPAQIEASLRGEASNVRLAVGQATQSVQTAGLQEIRAALTQHSESVRNAMSLDREGPVRALRNDLLAELNGTRKELGEQLTAMRAMLQVAEAQKTAGAKSSRAVGAAFEVVAMAQARDLVTAAGDVWEEVGNQAGEGTTRRTGDGVATLATSAASAEPPIRVLVEAKARTRPLSLSALRREAEEGRKVRNATGAMILVRNSSEVPGGLPWAKVDALGWVVAADDEFAARLIYLFLREKCVLLAERTSTNGADMAALERQLKNALEALEELSTIGRLVYDAEVNLQKIRAIGKDVSARIQQALNAGLHVLRQ